MAEGILNAKGKPTFAAYSAGSFPKGAVHPMALDLLRSRQMPIEGLRSKSWHEFARADAPIMDFVITVCDNAANEVCPIWPGQPITAHWGVPDPAAVEGSDAERMAAFGNAYDRLEARIRAFSAAADRQAGRAEQKRKTDWIESENPDKNDEAAP